MQQIQEAYRVATISEALESVKESKNINIGIVILGISAVLLKKTEKLLLDEEEK